MFHGTFITFMDVSWLRISNETLNYESQEALLKEIKEQQQLSYQLFNFLCSKSIIDNNSVYFAVYLLHNLEERNNLWTSAHAF